DRCAFAPGQGPRGAELPDGVYAMVKSAPGGNARESVRRPPDAGRDFRSECDSACGGDPTGDQRLHASLSGKDLQERTRGCPSGPSRRQRADRGSVRRFGPRALSGALSGYRGVSAAASPTAADTGKTAGPAPALQTERGVPEGHLRHVAQRRHADMEGSTNQQNPRLTADGGSVNSEGRAKAARPPSRLYAQSLRSGVSPLGVCRNENFLYAESITYGQI